MSQKRTSKAAAQLAAISRALIRQPQLREFTKELKRKIGVLQQQLRKAEDDLDSIAGILAADPDLTAVAREIAARTAQPAGPRNAGVSIRNPKYVSSEEKRALLLRILRDYSEEHPEAEEMSYGAIKSVLSSRYGIETASAGLFFRNELGEWESRGGNKNKRVVIKTGPVWDQES